MAALMAGVSSDLPVPVAPKVRTSKNMGAPVGVALRAALGMRRGEGAESERRKLEEVATEGIHRPPCYQSEVRSAPMEE